MGRTSIPCSEETRDILADEKPDGVSWDDYLRALAGDTDALGMNSNELEYDDVRNACAAAIRSELPTDRF